MYYYYVCDVNCYLSCNMSCQSTVLRVNFALVFRLHLNKNALHSGMINTLKIMSSPSRCSPLTHEALSSVEQGGVGERSIPYKNPVLPARGLLALWVIPFLDTRVEFKHMYIFTKTQSYTYIKILKRTR